jgi:hypothetical protein
MDVEGVAKVLANERCVLFLGSGVSIPAPSSLPSAAWIVRLFLEKLAEGLVESKVMDALVKRWPLPEFVYGTVERYFGPEVYEVWAALDLWRNHGSSFSANAGHVAAVHASSQHSTQVLTPNFDTYLESAAQLLGVETSVTVATPGKPFRLLGAEAGRVEIWKLHGTVQEPSTIFSSVRTLTSPIDGLAEAIDTALDPDVRLVLAGYSGRDLDLFPLLARRERVADPIWVDTSFPADHRSQFLSPAAIQVSGSFDDVGRAYARDVGGSVIAAVKGVDSRAAELKRSRHLVGLSNEIAAHIEAVAARFVNAEARSLILAELLVNAGLLAEAERLLIRSRGSDIFESERLRLRAKSLWELGRFQTSRAVAIEGVRRRCASKAEKDTLRFAIAAADLRIRVPPRHLTGTKATGRLALVARSAVWGWVLVKGFPRLRRLDSISEPARTSFVEGYLEHTIRILVGLQFALTRRDGTITGLAKSFLARGWRRAYRESIRVGYAEGIGNAGRYLARLDVDEPGGVRAAHQFLGHTLGVAIAFRDAATRALRDGKMDKARADFGAGIAIAEEQNDPVLLLTFLPLSEALGLPLVIPEKLIAAIEAPWAQEHLNWSKGVS